MSRKWFDITARADVAEISIYDVIGSDWGGVGPKEFDAQLKQAGNVSHINLSINSPGGLAFDGIAIYNMLKRHKASVTVRVDGVAASIASVIAMAGDTILMPENAMMMIHDPSSLLAGDAETLRAEAEVLDKLAGSLIGIYATRSGQPHDVIKDMMAKETWLSAEEAVALGFADKVDRAVKAAALACFDLKSHFQSVPAALADFVPVDIAAKAAATRESEITAACSIAGKPDKAAAFVASDKSLAEVVHALQAARSPSVEINTRHSTANADKAGGGWDKAIARVNKRFGVEAGKGVI